MPGRAPGTPRAELSWTTEKTRHHCHALDTSHARVSPQSSKTGVPNRAAPQEASGRPAVKLPSHPRPPPGAGITASAPPQTVGR